MRGSSISLLLGLLSVGLAGAVYLETLRNITRNLTPAEITEPDEDGLWSTLLEEWTLGNNEERPRDARILQSQYGQQSFNHPQQQPQPVYIPHNTYSPPAPNKYIPASNYYFGNRLDNAENIELMDPPKVPKTSTAAPPPPPPPKQNFQNLQSFTPIRQAGNYDHSNLIPSQREVSETDLFLLSAIEKLTYRVDHLEQRLKKNEQILFYMLEGENNPKPACPRNYTKVGDACYFFGTDRGLNWKSASAMCKSLGGQLAELDPRSKQKEVIIQLLNDFNVRGKDFWVGGLNPGLLWIWINSGKPVDPNTKLETYSSRKSKVLVPVSEETVPTTTQETPETTTTAEVTEEPPQEERILQKTTASSKIVNKPASTKRPSVDRNDESLEIRGSGRCLRLSYSTNTHSYGYYGVDCSFRTNYLCEYRDRDLENEIGRVAKALRS